MRDEGRGAIIGNIVLAVVLTVATMSAFWAIGYGIDPHQAAVLRTPVDDAIPFWPWSVYLYTWVYTAMFYPLFVVRCQRLFRRVIVAYGLALAVHLVTYAVYPVTSLGFRPDLLAVDASTFHGWGVRLTFWVDPPMNLFPSMHLSIATLSALSAYRARREHGLLVVPVVLGIALSILTMKQHYIVDGLAALALAALVYAFIVRPYQPPADGRRVAADWRGPLAYYAFHGFVYVALYVAYRAGLAPWEA